MTYPNDFPRCRGQQDNPECFRCERFIAGVETMLAARHDPEHTFRVQWIVSTVKPCPERVEKKV